MATLDQGVHNLDELISSIVDASGRLQAHNKSLESLDEALSDFADTVGDAFEALDDQLQSSIDALDDATSELESELGELAVTLRAAATEQLEAAGQRADDAGSELTQELEGVRTGLSAGFGALDASGFQVLGAALQAVLDGTNALSDQVGQAFADLDQALQDRHAQLAEEREPTDQSLEEAAEGLQGDDHDTLLSGAEESIAGWSEEVPAAIESETDTFGPEIAEVYDTFQQEAGGAADAIMAGVDAVLREGEEAVQGESTQLQSAVEATGGHALAPLDEEEARVDAAFEAGALLSDTLDAMQADFEVTPRLVGEIERLLQAVE